MKTHIFTDDPIQDRRNELELMIQTDHKIKRIDMTSAANSSKLTRYPLTGTANFNSQGVATYRSLRSEFFAVLVSQMIMLDVMYNYVTTGDEGLAFKDGFGPVPLKDMGNVDKKNPFPENPYAGSILRCEQEAYTIFEKNGVERKDENNDYEVSAKRLACA